MQLESTSTPRSANNSTLLVGEWISQVPPHAENDHLARELTSLERIGWGNRHGFSTLPDSVPQFAMEPTDSSNQSSDRQCDHTSRELGIGKNDLVRFWFEAIMPLLQSAM